MPARSKKQQMAAGAALSAKRGETPKSKLKGASKQMSESMSEKQLSDIASTSRKKLPTKKSSGRTEKSRSTGSSAKRTSSSRSTRSK